MIRTHSREWRYWLRPERETGTALISLPRGRLLNIDYLDGQYREVPEVGCYGLNLFIVQPSCPVAACAANRVDEKSPHLWRRGPIEVVNGHRAVRFDARLASESTGFSIWLAPSLGCLNVKTCTTWRNVIGLPTRTKTVEITQLDFGEPDGTLFSPPASFRQLN